jgi:cbb3-type cytochrome oxidase maturation protein
MSVFYIIISASLIIAIGFLCAFIWSVKTHQYEDDYTPAIRMLFENETEQTESKQDNNSTTKLD